MKIRRSLLISILALATLLATEATAQAAATPEPTWKLLAATGPTHLPTRQSEVQRVSVGAEEGTFTLSHALAEGKGTLTSVSGLFPEFEAGSNVVSFFFFPEDAEKFEPGQVVTGSEGLLPPGAVIEAIEPGKVIVSEPAVETGFAFELIAGSTEITDVSGNFAAGDELSGEGISAGTTVTAVGPGTLTVSQPPTAGGTVALSSALLTTAPLPYDATAAEVQAALEALPGYRPGAFTVTGGPGGSAGTPFAIAFGGSLADQNVAEFDSDSSGLGEHGYASVFTVVPGGPGTGSIAISPTNLGGAPTSGEITVELGPLPEGIVTAGDAEDASEFDWDCTTETKQVECTSSHLTPAISPAGVIRIPIEVEWGAEQSSQVEIQISGGGAAQPASYQLPIVVSNSPAKAGISAMFSGAFEADGSPSTQAGGHPNGQLTAFQLNTIRAGSGRIIPAGDLRDLNVDLPPGFLGNPLVTDRCPPGMPAPNNANYPVCGEAEPYKVGALYPETDNFGSLTLTAGVFPFFNDIPVGGYAAEFSSKIVSPVTNLLGSVRTEDDFGVRITSPNSASTFAKLYYVFSTFEGFPAGAKGKAFLRNATDCAEQARQTPAIRMSASSWQHPDQFAHAEDLQAPVTGCDKLEFEPQFTFQPTSTQGASPVGAVAELHIDQSGLTDPDKLATPDLKRSVVQLPEGFTVNPSQANGLEACSEAQVGYLGQGDLPNPTRFNNSPVTCPDASKLGTVEATTPLLEEPLKGTIYLAEQEKNPFGSLIGLYLVIESKRFGITLKLPGKVDTDPNTGQISATFDYVPQQPVEDLKLNFRGGGPRSEFATPEVCGQYSTKGTWTPWSAPESGPPAQTSDSFQVSSGCSASAASRPFAPSFEAGTVHPVAGAYSPLVIKVNRKDGEQELTNLDFTLPPGMSGKLAGVPYCSEAQIAAAATRPGKDELASPSCSGASRIGTVDAAAGVGSEPVHVQGAAYLAGPYKGAPVSAVVITPAVAGPFDLGTVVIRSPLHVNPETTQITAQSDAIPTILKGIPLKIRSVAIQIDRPGFTINPTNCDAMSVYGTITSSSGQRSAPANRFQVGNCAALGFKPKLKLRLKGGTGRTKFPKLIAELTQPAGQANIRSAQVLLPRSEFLEQGHIGTVCTRVQFNAESCPAQSVYGQARAWSPLIAEPLSGPVYLRSNGGERELPDLVARLRGPAYQPIEVDLAGYIDSAKSGGLRSTFAVVPDAPVSRFVLEMQGGKKGLLVNSENLCKIGKAKRKAKVKLVGQNGKQANSMPLVANDCRKSGGGPKRRNR